MPYCEKCDGNAPESECFEISNDEETLYICIDCANDAPESVEDYTDTHELTLPADIDFFIDRDPEQWAGLVQLAEC